MYTKALLLTTGKYPVDAALALLVPTLSHGAMIDIQIETDLHLDEVDHHLNHIYGSTYSLDRYDLNCAVVFHRRPLETYDVVACLDRDEGLVPAECTAERLVAAAAGLAPVPPSSSSDRVQHLTRGAFATVAVGGTFDHLHEGHKILLSESLFLARETLIVGVTGPKLLVGKQFSAELQSYEDRVRLIREFVARLLPAPTATSPLAVDIYMIEDVCGPTGYLSEIDALVISAETRSGGAYVNEYRTHKGMKPLAIVEIGVITPGGTFKEDFSTKLSSTKIRERVHRKRQEEAKPPV